VSDARSVHSALRIAHFVPIGCFVHGGRGWGGRGVLEQGGLGRGVCVKRQKCLKRWKDGAHFCSVSELRGIRERFVAAAAGDRCSSKANANHYNNTERSLRGLHCTCPDPSRALQLNSKKKNRTEIP
jgi:hypothetical protein